MLPRLKTGSTCIGDSLATIFLDCLHIVRHPQLPLEHTLSAHNWGRNAPRIPKPVSQTQAMPMTIRYSLTVAFTYHGLPDKKTFQPRALLLLPPSLLVDLKVTAIVWSGQFEIHCDPFWSVKKLAWANDLCLIVSRRTFFPTHMVRNSVIGRLRMRKLNTKFSYLSVCLFVFHSFLRKDFGLQFQGLFFLWYISLKEHREDCVVSIKLTKKQRRGKFFCHL